MEQKFQVGDIIQHKVWDAHYIVISTNAADQYGCDKENYMFKLLSYNESRSHIPEPTLVRSRDYVDSDNVPYIKIA